MSANPAECEELLNQVMVEAERAINQDGDIEDARAKGREAFQRGCIDRDQGEELGTILNELDNVMSDTDLDYLRQFLNAIVDNLERQTGNGNGGQQPQTAEAESGQATFGAVADDSRRTGRVISQGIVQSAEITEGRTNLVAQASDGGSLPPNVEEVALRTTKEALGILGRYIPERTRASSFVWDEDEGNEIQNLTVGYNVERHPPEQVASFEFLGETTPEQIPSELDPNVRERMRVTPQNRFLEDNIGKRYSYCAPVTGNLPETTVFTTWETQDETRDDMLQLINRKLGPNSTVVPGPLPGTFKPSAGSALVLRPPSDVAGIDTTIFEDNGGSGGLFGTVQSDLCFYVEITRLRKSGDWTVIMDVRGEGEEQNQPRIGVDLSDFTNIPRTLEGAWASALQAMTDRSPNALTTSILDRIEDNPDIIREANDPDEPSVEDQFGSLEPQQAQSQLPSGGGESRGEKRSEAAFDTEQASEKRDEEQMDIGTAGGTKRLDQFAEDNED